MSNGGFVVVVLSAGAIVGVLAAIVVFWFDDRRVNPPTYVEVTAARAVEDWWPTRVRNEPDSFTATRSITVANGERLPAGDWIEVTTFGDTARQYVQGLPDSRFVWLTEDGWFGLPDMRQHEVARNTPPPSPPDAAQLPPSGERAIRVREDE